jgi:hypothetical protein
VKGRRRRSDLQTSDGKPTQETSEPDTPRDDAADRRVPAPVAARTRRRVVPHGDARVAASDPTTGFEGPAGRTFGTDPDHSDPATTAAAGVDLEGTSGASPDLADTDLPRDGLTDETSAPTDTTPLAAPTRLDDVRVEPSLPPGDLPSHPASARRAVWLRERGPTFPSNNWVASPPAFATVPAVTGEFARVGDGHSWVMVYEGGEATALRYELFREAGSGHRLHGLLPSPLARCASCGTVAYHLGDATWALVELTGSGGAEPLPLPRHTRVESFDALRDLMARHEHST